jgi:hypothetical protein
MISRIKAAVMLGALLLAPIVVSAQTDVALRLGGLGGDTVAYCCTTLSSSTGQGCFAVVTGSTGLGQCKGDYMDCGSSLFACVPSTTALPAGAPAGTVAKDCSCQEVAVP